MENIGQLTGVDVKPIYKMEAHRALGGDYLTMLDLAETEEEENEIREREKQNFEKLKNNLEQVMSTIEQLIEKFPLIVDQIKVTGNCSQRYFSMPPADLVDNSEHYFLKDLKRFKDFLVFVKTKGTTTVRFNFG